MQNFLKKKVIIFIFILFFIFSLNVNGSIVENTSNNTIEIKKIINEREIAIPDSNILLRTWNEKTDEENNLPYYSIILDGGKTDVRTVQASYELGLRYAHFDPLLEKPYVEPTLEADNDTNLFIVQFLTQPLEEFKNAIVALGGIVYQYIAQYAYLVKMNENVKNQVEKLQYVRWVGPYHPAYKLEEYIIDNYKNAEYMYPLQRYNIQVHTIEQKEILANRIKSIGGIVDSSNFGKKLISATLTPEQLFIVSRYDEVNFIDHGSEYEADMDIGREIGGANYIETIAGYTGADVRGESFDSGFNLNHVDFQNNPLIVHGPSCGSDFHGTACAGICFGDGAGNSNARGLLPDGQGIVADYNVIGLVGQSRYDHSGELVQNPYNAVFQTASVGSERTTQYTTISADSDQAIFDFDLVHCQSQSNAGTQMSRPQAWAKNMISGGAINHYNTLDKADDCWCYCASIGPAADGRIKPTFVFFYDDILTVGYPGNNDYNYNFGGTSGATPMIAGYIGLFFQMWDEGIFGNNVNPNGSVFENKAHFTTAKAMLINTAEQYEFTGIDHDKTRMHQGWGMPNLKNMYDISDNVYVIDETDVLKPFEKGLHNVFVDSETPALKVTMTYADTPGNPAVQSQHRINDLTLKVISPSETVFWGNNGLFEGIWSEPGGNPDTKNTVECVYIENPEPGAWIIEISADELIEDSHVETPEMDADYALVISPVLTGPNTPEVNGPTEGNIGDSYDFTFATADVEKMDVYYYIDWDDGTYTEWTGPYPSGEKVNVSHTWFEKGNHSIKVKAKNSFGIESTWSEPHIINIIAPELNIDLIIGGFWRTNIVISNIGGVEATNVSWSLLVEGGFILTGRKTSGTISSILPGEQVKVKSNVIIGIGEIKLNVNTEEPYGSLDSIKRNGKVFGIYIRVIQGEN